MPSRLVPNRNYASRLSRQRRQAIVSTLLVWYDEHRRDLPWRARPGRRPDPYRVWLSEIMLQQTTVAAVIPRFQSFVGRWPDLQSLAAAPVEEVMSEWAGLGYYSRARNLHACAVSVMQDHRRGFPADEAELRRLPGIGPYTAAAIASIAFDRRAAPVDANIERVLSRLFAVREDPPRAKREIRTLAAKLAPEQRAGDFAQAMMDLGAAVCTPGTPSCDRCPWRSRCRARRMGCAGELPLRRARLGRPLRRGIAYVAVSRDGAVLLRRRPPAGLLGGMHELPASPWAAEFPQDAKTFAPVDARFRKMPGIVRHGFTHFLLELQVWRADAVARAAAKGRGEWAPLSGLSDFALPTVMRKVVAHALAAGK